MSIPSHYSLTSLNNRQEALLKLLQKDIHQGVGVAIEHTCGSDGVPFLLTGTIGPRGVIVKITGDPFNVSTLVFTIHHPDDTLINTLLYEIEPVSYFKSPTKKELDEIEKERRIRIVDDLLTLFNRKTSEDYEALLQSLKEGERGLKDTEKMFAELVLRRKRYSKQIKDTKEKIEKGNFNKIALEEMMLSLQEIYKNKNVERVYVNTDKALTVVTKMLHANDQNGPEIGRFVFVIPLDVNYTNIRATNLDYRVNEHPHPNIGTDNHICWGANARAVSKMYKSNYLYQLVDFMMAFFTTFPHEDGSPFVNYDNWLQLKGVPRGDTDHFLLRGVLLEIPQPSRTSRSVKSFLAQLNGKTMRVVQRSSEENPVHEDVHVGIADPSNPRQNIIVQRGRMRGLRST